MAITHMEPSKPMDLQVEVAILSHPFTNDLDWHNAVARLGDFELLSHQQAMWRHGIVQHHRHLEVSATVDEVFATKQRAGQGPDLNGGRWVQTWSVRSNEIHF